MPNLLPSVCKTTATFSDFKNAKRSTAEMIDGFLMTLVGFAFIGVIVACSSAISSSLLYRCTPLVSVCKSITAGLEISTAFPFSLPLYNSKSSLV